jgi:hypothetical protein
MDRWRREGEALVRDLKFDDFQMAGRIDQLKYGAVAPATIAPSPDERRRQLPK